MVDSFAESIAGRSFELSRRGYERRHVDAYLSEVSAKVADLEEQLKDALIHLRAVELRQRGSREASESVESAYVAAADAKQKLLADAEAKASDILRKAEMEAAQLLAEPRAASEHSRREAEGLLRQAQARLDAAESEAKEIMAAAEDDRVRRGEDLDREIAAAREESARLREDAIRSADAAVETANRRATEIIQEATEQASEVYETERRRAIERLAQTRDEYEELARSLRALKDATGDMLTNALRDHEAIRVVLDQSSIDVR